MYIERALYKNVGPLRDISFQFPFNDDGTPKPVILVGENGCGKSTFLSNIIDAFYEMASTAYNNALFSSENAQQYFKTISPIQIQLGQPFMYTYISFKDEPFIHYFCKSGKLREDNIKKQLGLSENYFNWDENANYKKVTITDDLAEKVWTNNVICFFGPDRFERPYWMGKQYYDEDEYSHPSITARTKRYLNKPITVKNVTSYNLQWLLDIITDSRLELLFQDGQAVGSGNLNDFMLLLDSRKNIEKILSEVMGKDVRFELSYRNQGGSRLKIVQVSDGSVVCPTLDSLSTGQIALFNMFSTIVRYADMDDINRSIHLDQIEGIVVIDEIELHLHTKLQKEALPRLMSLFPKVQFVITTHAPLFLLGLKETYGEDRFDVYELPSAAKINIEKFSEFQRAYEYLKETEAYSHDVKLAIQAIQSKEKAVIITEGSTDWKHMKAALQNLKVGGLHQELFDDLDFEFLEYEPAESAEEAPIKLKMGNTVLTELCENMAKIPHKSKYIFVADRDHEQTNKKMTTPDSKYKYWGNNVYSLILPLPNHREATPDISIEHYYSDKEIKTSWTDPETGVSRRLFMGNEFDERGIAFSIDRHCEKRNKCGETSIAIIEGCSGEKVTSISNPQDGINYALPKSKFAKLILDKQAPFDNFNFDSFIALFEIIKEIINQPDQALPNDGQGA